MATTAPPAQTIDAGWDRSGWLGDGIRLYGVGLGVLVAYALVALTQDPHSFRAAPVPLRFGSAAVVVLLAVAARWIVVGVLRDRGALVASRLDAARRAIGWYAAVALCIVWLFGRADAYPFALIMGAPAMTSPGVLLVVLDGSPPRRGVLRVLLAAALTPLAAVVGYVVGFAAFWVSTMFGSFVFGVLAGHLVTFVPLALVGPGPNGAGPVVGTEG